MTKTLKNLVLKTATVTGVKLAAPADRIGLGRGVAYPMDNLSQGQFSLPPNPEPEQVRSREMLSAMQPPMQLQVGGDAVPPTGSVGCFPGALADRFVSPDAASFTSWQRVSRTAAVGSTRAVRLHAVPSRDRLLRDLRHDDRIGSDCQSPDRLCGKPRFATQGATPAATAGK